MTQLAELAVLLWERVGKFVLEGKSLGTQKSNQILDNPFVQIHGEFCQWHWLQIWPQHLKKDTESLQLKQLVLLDRSQEVSAGALILID